MTGPIIRQPRLQRPWILQAVTERAGTVRSLSLVLLARRPADQTSQAAQ